MPNYQTLLSQATAIKPPRKLGRILKGRIAAIMREGNWWCRNCEARCEREEGEQGQPAHCEHCGSFRITEHRG